MKLQKMVEYALCDVCSGTETYCINCIDCGIDVCWTCSRKDTAGKLYPCGVYITGAKDGFYCYKCLLNPPTPLRRAYQKILDLREEAVRHAEYFKEQVEKSETALNNALYIHADGKNKLD